MSSGTQHNKYNTVSLILLAAFVLFLLQIDFYIVLLFVMGALLGTFLLGPDLDIKSQSYYRWGMYKWLWSFYQKFFNHRSFMSHLPIISDVIRVFFLFAFFVVAWLFRELDVFVGFSISYALIGILFAITLFRMNGLKLETVVTELLATIMLAVMYMYLKSGKEIYFVVYEWELFIMFAGLVYSTTVHTFSDVMYSSIKKLKKKKKKKRKSSKSALF